MSVHFTDSQCTKLQDCIEVLTTWTLWILTKVYLVFGLSKHIYSGYVKWNHFTSWLSLAGL